MRQPVDRVFDAEYLGRVCTRGQYREWWLRLLLWFLPAHIKMEGDFEFHFKLWRGKLYLVKSIYRKVDPAVVKHE